MIKEPVRLNLIEIAGKVAHKRFAFRAFFVILLVIDLLMMFSTITRGAFLSLTVGTIYMAYICRKELHFVKLVSLGAIFTDKPSILRLRAITGYSSTATTLVRWRVYHEYLYVPLDSYL